MIKQDYSNQSQRGTHSVPSIIQHMRTILNYIDLQINTQFIIILQSVIINLNYRIVHRPAGGKSTTHIYQLQTFACI